VVKPKRRRRANGVLLAWVSIGVVVAVVLTVVLVKTLDSSGPQRDLFGPATPAVMHDLTTVPASVFNTIGVNSPTITVDPHTVFGILKHRPKHQPPLVVNGLPAAFYYGAEYCPYCAATRWGIIIALARFGSFTNNRLYNMFSSSTDYAPNTPSFSFYNTSYKSKYIAFTGYEVEDRNKQPLMTLPPTETALVNLYNRGMSFPFMDIANKTFIISSAFDPLNLAGYTTQSSIASQLTNTTSPVTQAIITTANYVAAGICASAKSPPASVCSSSGVERAAAVLGLNKV
jgi:thiol-disulfide isomerase/thioredoxin